jgi:hypothetical protein
MLASVHVILMSLFYNDIFLGRNIQEIKNISYKKIAPHTAKASTSRLMG